ncbi:mitochondrial outer membrane protein (Sam50) [Ascosphaera apis ARSEF 7405]|uniref:Mitochondrial outer membrane protein (Sam50) n=1 Tax=Ascosphaera apis ARSEF 7405 TaxID=392613 RepID=A0A168DWW3_9EURO|nr:mitochondrial outer membrane protein (Sam50) [Ascosphaera apis ARSEF 7405]
MASPLDTDDENILESLRQKAEPQVLEEREKAVNDRIRAIYGKAQDRLGELPIGVYLDRPKSDDPLSSPNDIDVFLTVKEKSRLLFKTGTDLGNTEGSAFVNALYRNIFGGAETLNFNASLGTRTRSAYQAAFESPILSNPDYRFEFGGIASSTQKAWSSHEEVLKGGWSKLRWSAAEGQRHELAYNMFWRQVTGLAESASPSVRADAGDSVKSSLSHTWVNDQRDHPHLPSRGYYTKAFNELAGLGPLNGDVAFWKSEVEAQGAVPVPLPWKKGPSGVSFTTGFRAGLLYSFGLDGDLRPKASRINDRFQLGGPTDVRGFKLCGIGPRDGQDALGGDAYAAGSANLFFPLPRVGIDQPVRLQAFINAGRLVSLQPSGSDASYPTPTFQDSISSTIKELGNGLPTTSAGVGLVYAHPLARFELNVSMPLVVRKGEEGRKGLQFGVGINFL